MIFAKDAKRKADEEIKNLEKLKKVLEYIDSKITEAAELGNYSWYLDTSNVKHLSSTHIRHLLETIKSFDYDILEKYDLMEHGICGWEIIWENADSK